jgi:hypothetical protein
LAAFYFRVWQRFTSEFGSILLPNLAVFYFQIWQYFTSEFGSVLLPNLAAFYLANAFSMYFESKKPVGLPVVTVNKVEYVCCHVFRATKVAVKDK